MHIKSSTIPVLLLLGGLLSACGAEHFSGTLDAGQPVDTATPMMDVADEPAPEDTAPPPPPPPPLLTLGAACTAAADCDSGFCADGVCCKDACTGLCLSCALADSKGTCTPHPLASDPENECADMGATTCGLDGMCDGAGKCHNYAAGTECEPAICTNAMYTPQSTCDGAGKCQKAALTNCGKFQCLSPVACRTVCLTNNECAAPNACIQGVCGGITGRYYNSVDFTTLALTRIDPNINFDWMAGNPAPTVASDLFSVRWTGTLTPRFTETYTFYIASSDGERLFLDNTSVINRFVDHTADMEDMGTRALEAGKAYAFKLEYYERYTNASIKLSWSSPSEPKAVIPTAAFSPQ